MKTAPALTATSLEDSAPPHLLQVISCSLTSPENSILCAGASCEATLRPFLPG